MYERSVDLTGQRFGRLVVLERCGVSKNGYVLWRCKCDCGNDALTKPITESKRRFT